METIWQIQRRLASQRASLCRLEIIRETLDGDMLEDADEVIQEVEDSISDTEFLIEDHPLNNQ